MDYDEQGDPVGVEILDASHGIALDGVPFADEIREALRSFGMLSRVA